MERGGAVLRREEEGVGGGLGGGRATREAAIDKGGRGWVRGGGAFRGRGRSKGRDKGKGRDRDKAGCRDMNKDRSRVGIEQGKKGSDRMVVGGRRRGGRAVQEKKKLDLVLV